MSTPRPSTWSAVVLTAVALLAVLPLPARAQGNPFKVKEEPVQAPAAPRPAPPKPAPPKTAPNIQTVAQKPGIPPVRIQGKAPQGARGGSFKVVYGAIRDQHFQEIQKVFRETRLLEDTAKTLNENFVLPADVTITMTECGEANAFYTPEKKTVALCYELIDELSDMFLADAKSKQEEESAGQAIAGATMFTLYHELGHAMIDVYDLPITGKEEDAVDQLATILLVEGGDEGEAAALNGAISFMSEGSAAGEGEDEDGEPAEPSYWDEHSLGEQRFYNIICWTYGKNPDGYEDLVSDGTLPEERAGRCEDEYAKMTKSWDALLAPHMKAN